MWRRVVCWNTGSSGGRLALCFGFELGRGILLRGDLIVRGGRGEGLFRWDITRCPLSQDRLGEGQSGQSAERQEGEELLAAWL